MAPIVLVSLIVISIGIWASNSNTLAIHSSDVATERHLPALRIVRVMERVVAARVRAEHRIVSVRRECQWRTAAPTADQLGGDQFTFFLGSSIRLEESIEGPDA